MPNLVGIGLSQVPTNGMLGGMAYQDPEHASIKNLDLKNLSQINTEIDNTVSHVFLYDTSKDSDGGAWRYRTQHTSWYNETLGTAYRGTRKEFPAVAVIVSRTGYLDIYDGDDPNLPLWMGWKQNSPMLRSHTNGTAHALNGIIALTNNGTYGGLITIDMIDDGAKSYRAIGSNNNTEGYWLGNIAYRNTPTSNNYSNVTGGASLAVLARENTTNVDMAVMPNAPIDPATGLPTPTIVVATSGGTSMLKPDGTILDFNDALGSTRPVDFSTIRGNDIVHWNVNNGTMQQFFDALSNTADSTSDVKYNYSVGGGHATCENFSALLRVTSNDGPYRIVAKDSRSLVAGANPGVSMFVDGLDRSFSTNNNSIEDSRVAYITSTYNTGWMPGDIQGAFLSDIVTEKDGVNYALTGEQDGTNRLSSETYSNGATSWQMVDNAGTANGYIVIALKGLTVGQTYKISMTWDNNATLDSGYNHRIAHKNSTADENDTNFTHWNKTNGSSETLTGVFTAQSANNDDLVIYANAITLNVSDFSVVETDDENGVEKIANYNFAANFSTQWEPKNNANTSYDSSNDRVTVTSTQNYSGIRLKSASLPPLTEGNRYIMTVDIHSITNSIRFGVVSGGTKDSVNSTGAHTLMFTAGANITEVFVEKPTGSNSTFVLNSVSIREAEEDRSLKNKGITIYGEITKEPVAPGADLMAYSNFNTSIHLRQPPNSDMNIGTGDAYEMIWFKTTATSGTMMMISYEGGAIGTNDYGKPFNIRYENGQVRGWASHNGFTNYDDVTHTVSTADGQWHCAAWVKRGQVYELYVDGEFIGSDTGGVGANALSDANTELVIGARKRGKAPGDSEESWNVGSLALARIGKSAPTAEQIKKIYENEKFLFQENAKATLYGTSSDVKAIAYDEKTELIHIGTASGRSDFQGLRRINNTTTAVTTAISAHDGFIVEQ